MRIHRLSREIANKIATDLDKCEDFESYLGKYLEALYVNTSDDNALALQEHPLISNPIKSKAVGRPKKGRIRCEKENTPAVKKKRGRPRTDPEKSLARDQSENTNLGRLRKRTRINLT